MSLNCLHHRDSPSCPYLHTPSTRPTMSSKYIQMLLKTAVVPRSQSHTDKVRQNLRP